MYKLGITVTMDVKSLGDAESAAKSIKAYIESLGVTNLVVEAEVGTEDYNKELQALALKAQNGDDEAALSLLEHMSNPKTVQLSL